jgi:hypothetical protein
VRQGGGRAVLGAAGKLLQFLEQAGNTGNLLLEDLRVAVFAGKSGP